MNMETSTFTLTHKLLTEYLNYYHQFVRELKEYEQAAETLESAAGTAQYGEEAALPKAQGGTSDPTYNQVVTQRGMKAHIDRRKNAVKAVESYRVYVVGLRHNDVLDCWLAGDTIIQTADKTKISKSTVQCARREIVDIIFKGELAKYEATNK